MKSVRLLSAAILATTGLIAVGATTQTASAASSKDLTVSHSSVVKNETFKASGTLYTHIARTVKLQYRSHKSSGAWTTKATTTSLSSGAFKFFTSTSKTRYYRYYAPTSGGFSKITGNVKKVSVVSQKVTEISVYNDSQCHFGALATDDVTVFVKFYPARWGRSVDLLTSTNGTLHGYQDRHGYAAFTFNPGTTNGSYHAVATTLASGGAPAKSSKSVSYAITNCVIIPL